MKIKIFKEILRQYAELSTNHHQVKLSFPLGFFSIISAALPGEESYCSWHVAKHKKALQIYFLQRVAQLWQNATVEVRRLCAVQQR